MRDRALSLALALLAILLFAGIFIAPKPQLSNSMASSVDQGEQGFAAFFQWLKARNVPVESWRERWFELDQRFQAGHVLVSSVPFRMQDEKSGAWADAPNAYVDAREKAAMLRWIAAGNTLVLPIGALDAEGNTREARLGARRELSYFDFFDGLGWTLSGSATESEDEQVDADVEDQDTDTDADASESEDEAAEPVDNASNAEKLEAEIAVANARPQALHQLQLQLSPNQVAHKFEHIAWEPQGSQALAFAPIDSTDECSERADADEEEVEDSEEDEGSEADEDSEDYADSEDYEDSEYDDSEHHDSGGDESELIDTEADAIVEASAEIDYSKDEISADGSTINPDISAIAANASMPTESICRAAGLKQALVLLRSTRDQSAAGWWLPFGRGGVVVLGYGSLWKNPNLAREGNAIAAQTLLTGFLKPGGVVLFDDYRYGLSSIYDPDALLADPRLYKTLGVIAVLWLLYAVGRSRRMLAVRVPEPRPSSATFARAISDFYARSLSDSELAQALGAHFLGSARRAYGISGADAEVWARLKREGGLDSATLNSVEGLSFGRDTGRNNAQLTSLILGLERRLRRA